MCDKRQSSPLLVNRWTACQPILQTLFCVLAGGLGMTACFAGDPSRQPNIVVILVDDMGYGDPKCYNANSKIPTPCIDSLAREGMRFTDAHAPGALCHLSRFGLMTGRYPWRQAVRWNNQLAISPEWITLPEFLQSQGYSTRMVGKWHLGFKEDPKFEKPLTGGPVDQGFDSFFGIRASTDIPPYFYIRNRNAVEPPSSLIDANRSEGWSPIQGKFWRKGGISPDLDLQNVLPRFTSEAIEVIDNHAKSDTNSPMFLYLAYPAPHTPWLPSEDYVGKSKAGLYGDFMTMVDAQIGRVLKALTKNALDQNTLVIFTSDNGPVWYEKDVKKYGHDSSGGLRGMKADAWECGHRMPFIVRWPGIVKAGTQTDQLICFTDIFATIADLLNKPTPSGQAPDSVSFLHTLKGKTAKNPRQTLVIGAGSGHFSIRKGPLKLITGPGSGGFSKSPKKAVLGVPKGQLYDLEADLAEEVNIYQQRPDLVQTLLQIYEAERSK